MPQVEQDYNLMQPTQTPTPATPETQTAQATDWRALFNQLVPQSTQPTGIVSPENAAALGPQSVPWLGLSSAMKGFEQGFNENRAQMEAKKLQTQAQEQAQIKAEQDRLKGINDKLNPIVSDYKSDEDIKDEKARSEAIVNIKNLLKNPEDFQNINMADVMKSYLIQAYKPQYKRLQDSGDVRGIADLLAAMSKEGAGKVINDFSAGLAGKGTFGADDAKEILKIIKPLEKQGSANYVKYSQKYNNRFRDVGLMNEGVNPNDYIDTLDWGFDSNEILKKYGEMAQNESKVDTQTGQKQYKTQAPKNPKEGDSFVNDVGIKVYWRGGRWVK